MALHIRPLTGEEEQQLTHVSQARTAAVRDVERARIILQASHGQRVPAIANELGYVSRPCVCGSSASTSGVALGWQTPRIVAVRPPTRASRWGWS